METIGITPQEAQSPAESQGRTLSTLLRELDEAADLSSTEVLLWHEGLTAEERKSLGLWAQ
jgi:hypothetical protein